MMNIKVFLAAMSLLIALGLSCVVKGKAADDGSTPMMCHDVGIATEAINDYRDALIREVQRYNDRDDRVAQVRRGVLIPLIEDLTFMQRFVAGFERENCKEG